MSATSGVAGAFVGGALGLVTVLAGLTYQQSSAPERPTWQQAVVTVDDAEVVQAAQAWGAPFAVEYAADADISVTRAMRGTHVGGEATKQLDGDRIVGCTITLRPETVTPAVLAHEVGHCYGLPHSNDNSRSLMFWVQGGDSGSSVVTDADRAALAALYAEVK